MNELAVSGIKGKEYTGKPVTQNIVIKNGNVVLDEGTDYTVSYSANTKVGTVEVTITGTGSYIGEIKSNLIYCLQNSRYRSLKHASRDFS